MGSFAVILKPLGSFSTILITRLLITSIITDQDTNSKYFCACHWYRVASLSWWLLEWSRICPNDIAFVLYGSTSHFHLAIQIWQEKTQLVNFSLTMNKTTQQLTIKLSVLSCPLPSRARRENVTFFWNGHSRSKSNCPFISTKWRLRHWPFILALPFRNAWERIGMAVSLVTILTSNNNSYQPA